MKKIRLLYAFKNILINIPKIVLAIMLHYIISFNTTIAMAVYNTNVIYDSS